MTTNAISALKTGHSTKIHAIYVLLINFSTMDVVTTVLRENIISMVSAPDAKKIRFTMMENATIAK